MKGVRLRYFSIFLWFAIGTSCVASKEPSVKERVITLNKEVTQPYIEVHLKNAKVLFSKNDVVKILSRELRSNLHKEIMSNKEKLSQFLSEPKDRYAITNNNQVYELEGMTSIIDKLLKKGKAVVFDDKGNEVKKIKLKEEFLLFGSYRKSFVFMDGSEIILTSARLGE